jgi:hypothetical protein
MEITLSELEAKVTEVSFIVIPIQRELFRKKNCKFDDSAITILPTFLHELSVMLNCFSLSLSICRKRIFGVLWMQTWPTSALETWKSN